MKNQAQQRRSCIFWHERVMLMFEGTVFYVPRTDAIRYAAGYLENAGVCVTRSCDPDVTHMLLPIPSFSGGDEYLAHLLSELPENVTVCGGNLRSPLLAGYRTVDFLQDATYLKENAAITAECTVQILEERIGKDWSGKKMLILGWGRIGKCLAPLLLGRGADVTVSARKDADLAAIRALGYREIQTHHAQEITVNYDAILNTIPAMVIPKLQTKEDAIVLELASAPGMAGENITVARGLPGKMAPKMSGKLIAETFLRLYIS
jgi:dipicolinate synthase subunit A